MGNAADRAYRDEEETERAAEQHYLNKLVNKPEIHLTITDGGAFTIEKTRTVTVDWRSVKVTLEDVLHALKECRGCCLDVEEDQRRILAHILKRSSIQG